MRKLITLCVCIITLTSGLFADNVNPPKSDANFFGEVVDSKTGEHLPYAVVRIKGTTVGTTTDASGHYYITNLPVGKFVMEVSLIGYATTSKEVIVKEDVSREVNFVLKKDAIQLDGVVISSNRNETQRKLAPALVSVIDMKILNSTNSTTLAQGLKFQPGVRVEDNCQNCGFTQVRINGLEGPYSQILIDSRPIYGSLTGIYGLEQIPANMIDRIEVIRGGGSALYGSSAIGGVINIITREPLRNSGSISHSLGSINGKAFENNTMFNASILTDNRKAGLMIYGQNKDRQGYDHDDDGFTEMPMLQNRSFGFRSFIKTGLYSKLTVEYHNMHEFRRGGDRFHYQAHEANIAEQLEHFINGGGINYTQFSQDSKTKFSLYGSVQHTLRKSYYGGGDPFTPIDAIDTKKGLKSAAEIQDYNKIINNNNSRLESYGRSTELVYQVGGQISQNFDNLLFMPAELTGGVEYLSNTLNDVSGYRKEAIDQKANTSSLFLQNEWKNDEWSFLIGGRLDKHSLVKSPIFSPRANIRYNPNGNINFRLSYSEGFRAPQYFDENLHIEIAGGKPIVHILDKNLKEERSRSFSGSVDFYHNFSNVQLNILLEGFYTHLRNPFTHEDSKTDENTKIIVNDKDGAKVYGLNVEGRMAVGEEFELQLGATFQKSLFETAREPIEKVDAYREFMRTPNTYGYFVATWKPIKAFSAVLSGNYTGSMYVPHEAGDGVVGKDRFTPVNKIEKSDAFFELGAKVTYDFKVYDESTLQLSAGVQNIFNSYQNDFDTGAGRASTYIYGPASPRNTYLGLSFSF